jgi:hypothetical protein
MHPVINFKFHDYFKNSGGVLTNLFDVINIKL